MKTKYVTFSGNCGCLPDDTQDFDSYKDAYDYLINTFNIDEESTLGQELYQAGYIDLIPSQNYGAEYCEISTIKF